MVKQSQGLEEVADQQKVKLGVKKPPQNITDLV